VYILLIAAVWFAVRPDRLLPWRKVA